MAAFVGHIDGFCQKKIRFFLHADVLDWDSRICCFYYCWNGCCGKSMVHCLLRWPWKVIFTFLHLCISSHNLLIRFIHHFLHCMPPCFHLCISHTCFQTPLHSQLQQRSWRQQIFNSSTIWHRCVVILKVTDVSIQCSWCWWILCVAVGHDGRMTSETLWALQGCVHPLLMLMHPVRLC